MRKLAQIEDCMLYRGFDEKKIMLHITTMKTVSLGNAYARFMFVYASPEEIPWIRENRKLPRKYISYYLVLYVCHKDIPDKAIKEVWKKKIKELRTRIPISIASKPKFIGESRIADPTIIEGQTIKYHNKGGEFIGKVTKIKKCADGSLEVEIKLNK